VVVSTERTGSLTGTAGSGTVVQLLMQMSNQLGNLGEKVTGSARGPLAKRGSYIKTVVLQSPGGSVSDALAMGRLIREKQFATEVEAERYCASSCPLVLAKGVEWRAGFNAAIGVHQVSSRGGENISASAGMENAQQIPRRARNTCATWVSIWRSGFARWKRRTRSSTTSRRKSS
jgi:hypothetical protein